jgi:alginate O-acetyltransferase complex protein AlgI
VLFPTTDFAAYFAVVFLGSWLLNSTPRRWCWFMLIASYVFYGWSDQRLPLLLAVSTAISWLGGWAVARSGSDERRKTALWVCVVAHLALLGWFKYYGFAALNLANALRGFGLSSPLPLAQAALPIGISFYTFMGISYVVDIWRRRLEPASPLEVAVYLSFFAHLVAGPIVRGGELLPQLRRRRDPRRVDYSRGAWLIFRGLAKKVVLSSYLSAAIVDRVFATPRTHSGIEVLFAVWAYAIQIYADFSGYTDIAIGVAMLLGIRFPDNFDRPYTASSLQDFWRRWHITLSRWLRDYLYIPLGGSRGSRWETVRNLVITMMLGGLWHGAGWTFLAWGAFHGIGQGVGYLRNTRAVGRADAVGGGEVVRGLGPGGGGAAGPGGGGLAGLGGGGAAGTGSGATGSGGGRAVGSSEVARKPGPWRVVWQRVATFQLVCVGWLLFRADSLTTARVLASRLVHPWGSAPLVTPLLVAVIAGALAAQYLPSAVGHRAKVWFSELSPVPQGAVLAGALCLITTLGPQGVAPFIYYRF